MVSNYWSFCLIGISACFFAGTVAREVMLNGKLATVKQFPYQVSVIIIGFGHKCGGGIIGDQFILTAAHCVIGKDGHVAKHSFYVLAGTNDLKRTHDPAVEIPVTKVYVPREFDVQRVGGNGDIAVLKLKHSLKMSGHIKKLRLPEYEGENFIDQPALIAGFGWDQVDVDNKDVLSGNFTDSRLRYDIAHIVDYCVKRHVKCSVPRKHICAQIEQRNKPRGTCSGDSGGPLVVGDIVVGVLSIGLKKCHEAESGSIYTSVSHYLDFIHHAVHDIHHDDIYAADV